MQTYDPKNPEISVRETRIKTEQNSVFVEIQISDVPAPYESASVFLSLAVRLPPYSTPLLDQVERQALDVSAQILERLRDDRSRAIMASPETDHSLLDPPRRR